VPLVMQASGLRGARVVECKRFRKLVRVWRESGAGPTEPNSISLLTTLTISVPRTNCVFGVVLRSVVLHWQ
jgi:hypothetical protein